MEDQCDNNISFFSDLDRLYFIAEEFTCSKKYNCLCNLEVTGFDEDLHEKITSGQDLENGVNRVKHCEEFQTLLDF